LTLDIKLSISSMLIALILHTPQPDNLRQPCK
jgi:hypothetical protein